VRLAALPAAVLAFGCGVAVSPATAPRVVVSPATGPRVVVSPATSPPLAIRPATAPPVCGGAVSPNRLGAIHFLTRDVGLGLTLRASPNCGPMLAVTQDGGRHWLTEGAALAGNPGVGQLTATSTDDVWAVAGNGRLMSTTDAGATWTAETPRGATWTAETPRGRVLALARSARALWILDCLGGSDATCVSVLVRKALPDGVWTIASPKLGPNPPLRFVLAGRRAVIGESGALVVVSDRGQRFAERPDPTWMRQPCLPAGLAAAGKGWWLLCLGGAGAGSSEKALLHTTDGGRTWTIASQVTSLSAPPQPGAITREEPDALVAATPTRLWLAALNNLFVSDDAGARWSRIPGPNPQGYPAAFDVLSPTHAWLLAAGQGLWRTTDGRHWIALGPVAVSP
jgi:photosystem II stability/assembly factor-like uncharacterized protein